MLGASAVSCLSLSLSLSLFPPRSRSLRMPTPGLYFLGPRPHGDVGRRLEWTRAMSSLFPGEAIFIRGRRPPPRKTSANSLSANECGRQLVDDLDIDGCQAPCEEFFFLANEVRLAFPKLSLKFNHCSYSACVYYEGSAIMTFSMKNVYTNTLVNALVA
jgi:hypothetical protein